MIKFSIINWIIMYHPSMWHPIDMAAAFRSIRPTSASPTTSPEKASNAANGAFSVNTLLNQSSADHLRFSSTHPSLTVAAAAAAAAHQHHLFSTLFQHYPYAAAFRPLLNGTPGLLTSSTGSKTSPSSSSSSTSSESSAFVPAGKKFKANSHDENHCETSSSDESFGKYPGTKHDCIQTRSLSVLSHRPIKRTSQPISIEESKLRTESRAFPTRFIN